MCIYTLAERTPTKCKGLNCSQNEWGEWGNGQLCGGGLDMGLEQEDEPLLQVMYTYMAIYLYTVLNRFMMEPA